MTTTSRVVALSGGIGGAKLAVGLSQVLQDGELLVIANTGDDFEHLGLHVSPDVDTLMYTLAGLNNPDTGWGRKEESWSFMAALEEIGGPTWFQLGDKDLALNLYRTNELRSGKQLSEITSGLAERYGIRDSIIPMTDDRVHTMIETDSGILPFQDYFVRQKCEPTVRGIRFEGVDNAKPAPAFVDLLQDASIDAFVICPSNPYLSIDPIISIPGVRRALNESAAPVIAVSPVLGGESVKGPTSKIMREMGKPCSAIEVAAHYKGLLDGIIIDHRDAALSAEIESTGVAVDVSSIHMNSLQEKVNLARVAISFAAQVGSD
ncbi:MAG: 2-phospho-L-lactate transferase [Woeseiaceae bacterium]